MEEADELQENIERLEGDLVELRAELAAKEDANNQLSKEGGTSCEKSRNRLGLCLYYAIDHIDSM
jgi:chromosome segregation ATPase